MTLSEEKASVLEPADPVGADEIGKERGHGPPAG
jgi:hypothetical protein